MHPPCIFSCRGVCCLITRDEHLQLAVLHEHVQFIELLQVEMNIFNLKFRMNNINFIVSYLGGCGTSIL